MLSVLPSTFKPVNNLLFKPVLLRDRFDVGGKTRKHLYSTCFAAMLQDKLHVFCCLFFRTFIHTVMPLLMCVFFLFTFKLVC